MKQASEKVAFAKSIGSRIAGGFGMMVVIIALCGFVGWYGVSRLSDMLTHVSSKVVKTDNAILSANGTNNAEDLSLERILYETNDADERETLKKLCGQTNASLAQVAELKVLPEDVVKDVAATRKENLGQMDKLLALDDTYQKEYNDYTKQNEELLSVMEVIEVAGDDIFRGYEQHPDQSVSWKGGLDKSYNAADGSMNAEIGIYQQAYFFESLRAGGEKKTCLTNMEHGTKFLDDAVTEFLSSDLGDAPMKDGPHKGEKVGPLFKKLVEDHQTLVKGIVARHEEIEQMKETYRKSGEALDAQLTKAMEATDKVITDTESAIPALQHTAEFSLLGALTFGVLIAIACAMFMSRLILKPIGSVVDRLQDIAQGEGDLTQRLKLNRSDEIGKLGFWFDTFVERIHKTVKSVADHTQTLSAASSQTASTSNTMSSNATSMTNQSTSAAAATEQASSSIRNVAAAIEEISANSNTVASEAGHVSNSLGQVGTAVEAVSGNMNTTAAAVEEMSTSLNTIASSVEEMSASLKGVSNNTAEAAQLASTAAEKADATAEKVNRLGTSAKAIDKVVDLITGIAEQTNLLALNATIEAASAGEAGKGFAVVANEVKELAKQTGRATQEIRQQVEDMQTNTGQAVTAISEIVSVIGKVNETFRMIASAVQEQSLTINEIVRNVSDAAKGGEEVSVNVQSAARSAGNVAQNVQQAIASVNAIAQSVNELALGANEIARNAAEASQGMNEVSRNVQEVNVSAQTTKGGAEELTTAAQGLSGLAGQLQQLVGSFAV